MLWLVSYPFVFSPLAKVAAETQLPGYAQAEDAFMRLTLDERVKLQVLLTAAGCWPAVPDADFNTGLFNAILRFEVDNGFAPLGILTSEQMDRLMAIAGPYLNAWRFQIVRHPMTNSQIWVPIGLPLTEESTATGLTFFNRPLGVALTYDYYPLFTLRLSFESLRNKLERSGATIYYSKLFRNEFFVLSYSDGITDAYIRYHQTGRGGVGFTLTWSHAATDAHTEGLPIFYLKDIPPVTDGGPPITQPRIYFGQGAAGYVVVKCATPEFDYPKGQDNAYTTYDGADGVPIGGTAWRSLFAWYFNDVNILLSGYIAGESRILLHRDIQDRVRTIAPFLQLDRDPYLRSAMGGSSGFRTPIPSATGSPTPSRSRAPAVSTTFAIP